MVFPNVNMPVFLKQGGKNFITLEVALAE